MNYEGSDNEEEFKMVPIISNNISNNLDNDFNSDTNIENDKPETTINVKVFKQ